MEQSIVEALANGFQSKEIADRIGRSAATVEFHIRNLYAKLNARSRAQLVARAYTLGYFSPKTQLPNRGASDRAPDAVGR